MLSVSQTDVIVGMSSTGWMRHGMRSCCIPTSIGEFCQRYFGRLVGHTRRTHPGRTEDRRSPKLNFAGFRERYETFFNEPLPECGTTSIRGADRRIFNDWPRHDCRKP